MMAEGNSIQNRDRRTFLKGAAGSVALAILHNSGRAANHPAHPRPQRNAISLATWSLVRSFRAGVWELTDVARICREDFNIEGIEYVTSFFEVPVENYLKRLNQAASDHGIKNVLIMVDGEGDMVAPEREVRLQAAINHRKWIEVAAYLGCHAIRCNARGGGESPAQDPEAISRAAEAFQALIDYAREFKINVLIENHGGLSSHPEWLPRLMEQVDSPHFGILPDYGNYHPAGNLDLYEAVRMAMPYAKGVSVKAGWQPDGTHPQYHLEKLLKISKDSGYEGFWGIESSIRRPRREVSRSAAEIKNDDWQAVRWTRDAIKKVVFSEKS